MAKRFNIPFNTPCYTLFDLTLLHWRAGGGSRGKEGRSFVPWLVPSLAKSPRGYTVCLLLSRVLVSKDVRP